MFKQHSVYLHRETNGYTVRFYEERGGEPKRYVFATADDLLDFLIVNFVDAGEIGESIPLDAESKPHWVIAHNPKTVVLE